MTRNGKLSIVIPVFNGATTIGEAVESVTSAFPELEVVINDNASTDDTREVCLELAARYPHVRYFRNDANMGFDRNLHLAVSRATSEYCWLVGDDDYLRPEGIRRVLQVLGEHDDLGVIYVNYSCVNRLTKAVVKERDCQIFEDRFFAAGPALLEYVGEYPNFMSTLVFRRSAWLAAGPQRYFDTYFVHYGVLLGVLPHHRSLCIEKPYVVNKSRMSSAPREPDFWAKSVLVILSLIDMVLRDEMLRKHPALRRNLVNRIMSRYMLEKIKLMKVNGGSMSVAQYVRCVRLMKSFPRFWSYFPLLVTPYAFQRPIVRLRNALRRI